MVAATLCGIASPAEAQRSVCAMGHKWLWNPRWGGYPPQTFLSQLDPLLDGVRDKMAGPVLTSDHLAGHLAAHWAERLGLKAGIPIPVGAFDAHWDAVGAGCRQGDVVNVVGTSTCIIAMGAKAGLIPGVCGIVPGSVDPKMVGIEAGLSAVGDIFEAIARRAATDVRTLSQGLEHYRPGQTGLLRLSWDNGDRTVLVNSELGGVTLGWNLLHTAQDELFAAIEGTAFHTRIVLERMAEGGVPIERVINAGGIPQNNTVLNQVYADVLNKPVLVPDSPPDQHRRRHLRRRRRWRLRLHPGRPGPHVPGAPRLHTGCSFRCGLRASLRALPQDLLRPRPAQRTRRRPRRCAAYPA